MVKQILDLSLTWTCHHILLDFSNNMMLHFTCSNFLLCHHEGEITEENCNCSSLHLSADLYSGLIYVLCCRFMFS